MTFAAGLLLIAAVIALVGWPFFRKMAARDTAPVVPDARLHWEHQKAEAYGAIKDAEFDFQTGKMSEVDFRFVRDKYAGRALEAIAALEQAKPKLPTGTVRFLYCPTCGNKIAARARFCAACGRALGRADDAA